jgi:hypothetical protein
LFGIYSAVNKKWEQAHMVILVCLIWKIVWGFLLTYGLLGNYDYYDMLLAFVWLFLRNKEYFAKVTFVLFYFLASTIKIHDGWILGNYFNSLYTGAPIFSKTFLPFLTNFVILMQIVGAWFLLSKNRTLYWLAFSYFLLFHIYSGVIVHYRYITISIPALLILYGTWKEFNVLKISRKTIFGYLFLLFLLLCQMIAIIIPGDQKKTLEGNYYGLYMFEANHQCFSTAVVYYNNSSSTNVIFRENHVANNRCDPYRYFYQVKNACTHIPNVQKITWTFDHSVNGHPYERIVDTQNACVLSYKPFSHNSWIKLGDEVEKPDIPVYKAGYLFSLENVYEPVDIYNNPRLLNFLTKFYIFLWTSVLLVVLFTLFHKTFTKR